MTGRAGTVAGHLPELDQRTRRLIARYARPDNRGWQMDATDILYRLRAWHGVTLTREQLAAVLGRPAD